MTDKVRIAPRITLFDVEEKPARKGGGRRKKEEVKQKQKLRRHHPRGVARVEVDVDNEEIEELVKLFADELEASLSLREIPLSATFRDPANKVQRFSDVSFEAESCSSSDEEEQTTGVVATQPTATINSFDRKAGELNKQFEDEDDFSLIIEVEGVRKQDKGGKFVTHPKADEQPPVRRAATSATNDVETVAPFKHPILGGRRKPKMSYYPMQQSIHFQSPVEVQQPDSLRNSMAAGGVLSTKDRLSLMFTRGNPRQHQRDQLSRLIRESFCRPNEVSAQQRRQSNILSQYPDLHRNRQYAVVPQEQKHVLDIVGDSSAEQSQEKDSKRTINSLSTAQEGTQETATSSGTNSLFTPAPVRRSSVLTFSETLHGRLSIGSLNLSQLPEPKFASTPITDRQVPTTGGDGTLCADPVLHFNDSSVPCSPSPVVSVKKRRTASGDRRAQTGDKLPSFVPDTVQLPITTIQRKGRLSESANSDADNRRTSEGTTTAVATLLEDIVIGDGDGHSEEPEVRPDADAMDVRERSTSRRASFPVRDVTTEPVDKTPYIVEDMDLDDTQENRSLESVGDVEREGAGSTNASRRWRTLSSVNSASKAAGSSLDLLVTTAVETSHLSSTMKTAVETSTVSRMSTAIEASQREDTLRASFGAGGQGSTRSSICTALETQDDGGLRRSTRTRNGSASMHTALERTATEGREDSLNPDAIAPSNETHQPSPPPSALAGSSSERSSDVCMTSQQGTKTSRSVTSENGAGVSERSSEAMTNRTSSMSTSITVDAVSDEPKDDGQETMSVNQVADGGIEKEHDNQDDQMNIADLDADLRTAVSLPTEDKENVPPEDRSAYRKTSPSPTPAPKTLQLQNDTMQTINNTIGGQEASVLGLTGLNGTIGVDGPSRLGISMEQSLMTNNASQFLGQSNVNFSMMSKRNFSQMVMEAGHREFYLINYRGPGDDLSKLLHAVGQKKVEGWREALPNDVFKDVKKLGEGQYGEVFKTTYNGQPVAMKIMPFTNYDGGYTGKVNGDALKDASLVIPEFLITRELSNLAHGKEHQTTNFIGLNGARVVRGLYPSEFLDAWDEFALNKGTENDRPDEYAVEGQLFLCIALTLGGTDLESYKIDGEEEATSILLQTMWALMVAEKELNFEHRDLHVGNVLVQKTEEERISFRLNGMPCSIKSCGVKVHIIDFTLSRMEKATTKIYLDASADPELFTGSSDVYQFEIYRMMRDHNKDDWAKFCPKSNVFWLHYLSRMCIEDAKYRKRTLKKRKRELQSVFDRILNYDSLDQFLLEDGDFFEKVMQQYLHA